MKLKFKTKIIDEYISKHKITKKQFCNICNISYSALHSIYQQKTRCSVIPIVKVCKVLDVKLHYFIEK